MAEKKDEKYIKRMADMLRQGSALTDLSCPVCASPLLRLKDGTLWCAKDEKKVIVVKEGEEQAKVTSAMAMEELQKLSTALSDLLDNLEKIKKMKKS